MVLLEIADFFFFEKSRFIPMWNQIAAVAIPWTIPFVSLFKGLWRKAALQTMSLLLSFMLGISLNVLIFLKSDFPSIPSPSSHPFPDSILAASKAGISVAEPLDANEIGIRNLPQPPEPQVGASQTGTTEINLWKGYQGGMYSAWIWANPNEPGQLSLRVFESSQNTPVSEDPLYGSKAISLATRHRASFSTNPNEVFFSKTNFKVYTGGWGQFYAARIELWFLPDSKSPERKLTEKVFKIEGWER